QDGALVVVEQVIRQPGRHDGQHYTVSLMKRKRQDGAAKWHIGQPTAWPGISPRASWKAAAMISVVPAHVWRQPGQRRCDLEECVTIGVGPFVAPARQFDVAIRADVAGVAVLAANPGRLL